MVRRAWPCRPRIGFMVCLLFPIWLCEKGAARVGQVIIHATREGQPIIFLSALFVPVMARGLSSERALRRRPGYHLPLGCPPLWRTARTGQPIIAFLLYLPPLWRTASERALRRRPGYHLPFCFICPPLWRGSSGPASHCLSAHISPNFEERKLCVLGTEVRAIGLAFH